MAFVHLHLHTEYSLLDGACRIAGLPARAKALGQSAAAITDHGAMYGVIDFYRACKKEGIKPIIGCEVYVAPRGMTDRTHQQDAEPRHLVLLCRDMTGYRNLSALVSAGWLEDFYSKPRIDLDLLRRHRQGLIALSACLAGEIPRRLLNGDYAGAKAHALEMAALFGSDGYYLELQDHGIPIQKSVCRDIIRLHRETGIPLVATNDAHYLTRADATLQDVLMCIQMGKTVEDPDRMRFDTAEFYLKSEQEMAALFPDCPEAITNTAKIADLCQVDFQFGVHHLPEFKLPPDAADGDSYFETLCRAGFARRYPAAPPEYEARLADEMAMIRRMGFVDYFLIVSDFIGYAKGRGIPVGPGRGSAAGSMVSFCLGITDVDPMKYALYFERFLNPERISMPDIDIDFCVNRRGEVIDYVNRKYGADHVAQIVTFGTMAARGAIRDVGRALRFTYAEVDAVAKQVPATLHMTLDSALKLSKPLRELYDGDPRYKALIDTARGIEGMPRHASTHAAGVVITRRPVAEYVPLATNDGLPVTQYTMTTLEELGLLKMDFLGLRNLTVLEDALVQVRRHTPDFTLQAIPDDDEATFKMLSDGQTSGVFQMESAGMTGVCVGLKPRSIEDITAIIALYRPGPMDSIPRFIACKQTPSLIRYRHPALEPILSVTYGCIVYQEQVIEIFRRLGGYSLGQADMMRRAISKKKAAEIEKERHAFIYGDPTRGIAGCVAGGIAEEVAQGIYDEIYDFANYAFNKAHAVCYAIIAYQTAWFKRHYTREYMAALLTSVLDSQDKVAEYISECRQRGIRLLPPDINESGAAFTVAGGDIRFGLAALKGVGRSFTDTVLLERAQGTFRSFPDFCSRMMDRDLNKRVLESLIRAGAFDAMGYRRAQLLDGYESLVDGLARTRRKNLEGQFDLFGGGEDQAPATLVLRDLPEFGHRELLAMEKEVTGLYLSGHPMDEYRHLARAAGAQPIGPILADFAQEGGPVCYRDAQSIILAGVVSDLKTKTTRNNSLMAYVTLEDDTAAMELLAFARVLDASSAALQPGVPVLVTGRLSARDEKAAQLMCDTVTPLSQVAGKETPLSPAGTPPPAPCKNTLLVRLPSPDHPLTSRVEKILTMFPGEQTFLIRFTDSGRLRTAPCVIHPALTAELEALLGQDNVALLDRRKEGRSP